MAIQKITKFPEKILLNKTTPVARVDDGIKALAKDMFDTMYMAEGVGLSANQIGVSKRIAVINPSGRKEDELVLINPEIIKRKGTSRTEEGCLSVPGASSEVRRFEEIEVKFMGLDGKYNKLKLNGLPARIVQHEIDHLNGLVFINRLSFLKRKILLKRVKKVKKI